MTHNDDTAELSADDYADDQFRPFDDDYRNDDWDFSSKKSGKLNPLVALTIVVGGTIAAVVGGVILPMNAAEASADKEVLAVVQDVATDVLVASQTLPGADTYDVGSLNADGEFEEFQGNVVPAETTNFVVRVGDADLENVYTNIETTKASGVALKVAPTPAAPGNFIVSGYNEDGASYVGPEFYPGQSATFNSLTHSMEVY